MVQSLPQEGLVHAAEGAQAYAAYACNILRVAGNTGAGNGIMQVTPLKLFSQAAEHPLDWDSKPQNFSLRVKCRAKPGHNLLW